MNKDDMILISVDDHIVEPPDMFKNHLPKKYIDDAPRFVHNPDGSDAWQFRDVVIPNIGLNAVAGRPKEEYGIEPQGLDEMRPGCYDVDERVKDMNAGGVLGSMCFPSFPGFAGRLFATEDPDFSLALLQAYNDWHIDEWCGAYPGRFIPMALPVIWDAEACAEEVRRNAKGRARADVHREPGRAGLPELPRRLLGPVVGGAGRHRHGDERAHRLVGPAGDHRAGRADRRDDHPAADEHRAGRRRPVVVQADQEVPRPQDRAVRGRHRLDPLLPRARRPHLRDALDVDRPGLRRAEARARCSASTSSPASSPTTSACSCATTIGIDNICWEADYPHTDSTWPNAPEELDEVLKEHDVPDDEINKMTYENAMRWYHFDPFTHITREQATVGALRKAAGDHDVSIQALSKKEKTGANFADFAANAKELTGNTD